MNHDVGSTTRPEHPEPRPRRRAQGGLRARAALRAIHPRTRGRRRSRASSPTLPACGTPSASRRAPTAILLALMALGIGPGDEVICPSFTFFATAGCVSRVGATPGLRGLLSLLLQHRRRRTPRGSVTSRTKAIMPVHLFGQSAEMDAVMELAAAARIARSSRTRRSRWARRIGDASRDRSAPSGCSASSLRRTSAASATAGSS